MLSLTACSSVKPAQPKQVPCPIPPALDQHPVAEKSFTERMESVQDAVNKTSEIYSK